MAHTARRRERLAVTGLSATLALVLAACGPAGARPQAPTQVTVASGPGTITVSWKDNSDDETGFAVLRATGGAYDEIAKVPADTTTYSDTDVTGAEPYTYEVAAIGAGGRSTSAPSEPIRPDVAGVPIVDPNDPVGVSLNRLGVDTTATPRVDENGDPLPSGYAPLGTTVTLGLGADPNGVDGDRSDYARYELFIGGAATHDATGVSNQVVWQNADAGSPDTMATMTGIGTSGPLFDVSGADRYRAAAGDVDGDGLDEFVLVDVTGSQVTVRVRDDAVAGYAPSSYPIAQRSGITSLDVIAGDFDADGTDTLAVALGTSGKAELLFLDTMASNFAVGTTLTFDASVPNAATSLELASGNLDDDPGQEVALTVNEAFQTNGHADGVSRYAVLDDAAAGFTVLDEGLVQGQDGAIANALVADVAVGNLDTDPRDEVVFAGLTAFHDTCTTYDLLYVALDDAQAGADLAPIAAKVRTISMGAACTASKIKKLRFIHVATGDLDGDGVDEIVGGPMVFDDLAASGGPWTELGVVPADQMYGHGTGDSAATLTRDNTALAVTDLDGDGSSEVLYVMANDEAVIRYGLPATAGDPLPGRTWWTIDQTLATNGSRYRPMLVPANIDQDSMVAELVPGDTTFTMTEPIILAAIAAAPCYDTISQNVGACGASYGQGTSTSSTTESKMTVTTSGSIGFKVTGGAAAQSEATVKATFSAAVSHSRADTYTLEKHVVYATGPLEDGVVFSTVPYDRYVYRILQHADSTLVGHLVNVNLPRQPIVQLVERSYFNSVQAPGAFQVDGRVFQHTVGDPRTYPTPAERDQLVQSFGGKDLENGPVSVGQGGGSTSVDIDVSHAHSVGGALEVGFSVDVEAVGATILGGFSVGVGREAAFTWTSESSTSYSASVGNIADPADFRNYGYQYGLFSYVYVEGDPSTPRTERAQFEVIDFWVQ